jgi:hypothetical protein
MFLTLKQKENEEKPMTKCKFCGNDIWRTSEREGKAYCENCNTCRPWHSRKAHTDKMTPSQERAVERIRNYFLSYSRNGLYNFTVNLDNEFGKIFVSVDTDENYLISSGGYFVIGRRGGIKCLVVSEFTITRNRDKIARHYERVI